MPLLDCLLIPSSTKAPVRFKLFVPRPEYVNELVQSVLDCSVAVSATSCGHGVLYHIPQDHLGADRLRNPLATHLRKQSSGSHLPDAVGPIHGPTVLAGENDQGQTISLDETKREEVLALYKELTRQNPPSRKAPGKPGAKTAKRDYDYFLSEFHESRKRELEAQGLKYEWVTVNAEAKEAWKNLPVDQKAPFMAKAAEDKARYEREQQEYLKKNPKPPKHPRTAFSFFTQDHKDGDWKSLNDEQKAPYNAKAKEDKARYQQDLEAFREHCDEMGKDFAALTASKKKKKKQPQPEKAEVEEKEKEKKKSKPKRPRDDSTGSPPAKKKAAKKKKKEGEEQEGEPKKKKKKKSPSEPVEKKKKPAAEAVKKKKKKPVTEEDWASDIEM